MKITVLGTGSWGTSLAKVLVENKHQVIMWGRDKHVVDEINERHTNHLFLSQIDLPTSLRATQDLSLAMEGTEMVLVVVPTAAMRPVMEQIKPYLQSRPIIVHATKGLEPETHLRMSQVIEQTLDRISYSEIVVLSGPSHAEEVARHDLTTITAACPSLEAACLVQGVFMNEYFRVYTNQDVIGVELGAALKNIIALGAGLLAGLGFGDNAKAGLVTRGLAEISRLGIHLGADPLTFLGLTGVGDLVVTCTSPHSRNWQAGNLLAKGYSKEEIEAKIEMVVEGISTTKVTHELAQELGIEMPITSAIYRILYEGSDVKETLLSLMTREGKAEVTYPTS